MSDPAANPTCHFTHPTLQRQSHRGCIGHHSISLNYTHAVCNTCHVCMKFCVLVYIKFSHESIQMTQGALSVFSFKKQTSASLGIPDGFANGAGKACTLRPLRFVHILVLIDNSLIDPACQISARVCGYTCICIKFAIFNTYLMFKYPPQFHSVYTCL